ncbi:MAG: crotonobetainyl-CoA:carnitine CoA-transferase CaiB-like acyl-CoA transferase [Hyphomicrobiaceae bacterium]
MSGRGNLSDDQHVDFGFDPETTRPIQHRHDLGCQRICKRNNCGNGMAGALDGITIVDLTTGAAGALSTMFMSDHGARVVRIIEQRSQLHRDGGYRVWDRGKEVVHCATDDEAGRGKLIAGADVVIEDFGPIKRPASLSAAALRETYPQLIVCSITAYGEVGPLAGESAIDDLVLARLGVLAGLPGFRDGPIHAAHPLPSVGAGLLAALGTAAALYDREATSQGRHVETSLVAGALLYHPKVIGDQLKPNVFQTNPYGSAPFYSVYECADGNWLQLGCVHHGFIARAAKLMGIADVIADPVYDGGHTPQTPEADAHLRKLLGEVMVARKSADWIADFEANDIPSARAQTNEDGMADPQVEHNGMIVSLKDPEVGAIKTMGSPIKMTATPSAPEGPRADKASDATDVLDSLVVLRKAAANLSPEVGQLPLAGVRVLEITNLIAGPVAGRLLADIGADVIKLEPPTGDISRPIGRTYFYSINYAKRSISVDASKPEGKDVVQRVASTCDVLLANLRPGATARMGIGHAADPNLIESQISGYGLTGPYAHRPGIDPLAQSLMGLERAQGGSGNPPSFTSQLAPTDFTTGTMAALGTVMALFARRRGAARGQRIEVNLLDGGIVLSSEWFTAYEGKPERQLADQGQHGSSPFHRLYKCRDGYIYVAADQPAEQEAFVEALNLTDKSPVDDASGTHPNDTSFGQAAATAFATLDIAAATDLLSQSAIPCAPALPPESSVFFDAPHTKLNGWSVTRPHPTVGNLTAVCRYLKFNGASGGTDQILPTPLLGQQGDEILREAGLSDDEVAKLRTDDVIITKTIGP